MSKSESLLIYLFSFSLSIFLAYIYQKIILPRISDNSIKNKIIQTIWLFLIILPPVLLSSIRYNVGTDYFNYTTIFNGINSNNQKVISDFSKEPLFLLLNQISYLIFKNVFGLFFFSSLIIHFFIISGINFFHKKISIPFALFIYYSIHFTFGLNGIRQMLAISIIVYAFKYIYNKSFKKYSFFIIIASLFHSTAIISLFFYFLVSIKSNIIGFTRNLIYYFSLMLSPFVFYILFDIIFKMKLFSKYKVYIPKQINISFNLPILVIGIVLPVFLIELLLIREKSKMSSFVNILLLAIPLKYLGNIIPFAGRLALYVTSLYYIIIPYQIKYLKKRNNLFFVSFYFILYFIFYYIYHFYILNQHDTYPLIIF